MLLKKNRGNIVILFDYFGLLTNSKVNLKSNTINVQTIVFTYKIYNCRIVHIETENYI